VPETAPRGIPKAIAGTLAAEIRKRREWDEAPCLYTLYVNGGRARLAPLPLPDHIWSGSPPQVLLAMADQADFFAPLLQTAAGPGLYGAAFRCEVWGGGDRRPYPRAGHGPYREHPHRAGPARIGVPGSHDAGAQPVLPLAAGLSV
jgi:hypothetical protein